MTVIRPNSISGINSITGNGSGIVFFNPNGINADVTVNNLTGKGTTVLNTSWNHNQEWIHLVHYDLIAHKGLLNIIMGISGYQ